MTVVYSNSELRSNLSAVLAAVVDDQEEAVITGPGREDVVIVPRATYDSLREMAYLMRSPANAAHITEAIERLNAGQGEEHDLIDPDAE